MSIYISSATASFRDAATLTTRPFSFGMWVKIPSTGILRTIWATQDPTSANNYAGVRITAANAWGIYARGGGTENAVTGGTVVAGWHYIVGRFISPTNDWLTILTPSGAVTSIQRTTSRTPVVTRTYLGLLSISSAISESGQNCQFAEYWGANVDIQPDGAALSDATLRSLAFRGPLSIDSIRPNITQYARFRAINAAIQTRNCGACDDIWTGTAQTQGFFITTATADAAGSISIGEDPPMLANGYELPTSYAQLTVI